MSKSNQLDKNKLIKILDIEYNSKTSRFYIQANPSPEKAHKNGFRLAIREVKKVIENL